MPKLTEVGEEFFTSAPEIYTHTWSIAKPAADVWAELAGDRPLHWCKGLNAKWTSPKPLGVGATRDAKVMGALSVKENFFRWDEGSGYAFFISQMNIPLFAAAAENYVIEPDGPNACRYTWTIAIRPSALGKPGKPVNKLLFGRFFADTAKYFGAS